jgi:DNA polymerase III epsilon subunit-like protein
MNTIFWDTETTGLPLHPRAPLDKQPRCIEFGAVTVNERGEEIAALSILIHPLCPLPPEITKITGLTDADLARANPFAHELGRIGAAFRAADQMIAHNLAFDRAILGFELARLGREDFPWPSRAACTVELHVAEWGRRPKLIELYQAVMGRPLAQSHRALDDARALAEIGVALRLHEGV